MKKFCDMIRIDLLNLIWFCWTLDGSGRRATTSCERNNINVESSSGSYGDSQVWCGLKAERESMAGMRSACSRQTATLELNFDY